MRFSVLLKGVAICLLISMMTTIAFAATGDGGISPYYSHTQLVSAGLSINSSGVADCQGRITVYEMSSEIQLNVRLQRKVGETWILVKKWSDSCVGKRSLYIDETYQVDAGTYRVIASGIVTNADGDFETVSCISNSRTYP